MEQKYKYKAFISYRHNERDRAVAEELQKMLERYKPPKSERKGGFEKWRVFRDETELNTSHSLSEEIKEALMHSEYLITVCSEDYNQSKWCLEELRQFKAIHGGSNDKIIAVLSDGSPDASFPEELRIETVAEENEEGVVTYHERQVTPLAANMRAETAKERTKLMKTEFLRVAAPLLGSNYDTLYQRWQRRKIRNILAVGGTVLAILLAFSIVSGTLLYKISTQQEEIVRQSEIAIANEQIAKENEEQAKKNEEIAKENETRAQENANRAEENADRAEANFKQAKKNEKKATANAEEARENARQAEENEKIAKENAKRAEENFAIAKENESRANANAKAANEERDRANTENRNTRIKNAEILTTQAEMYLENGEIVSSLQTAKQAMPIGENKDLPQNPAAEKVMCEAMNLYGEPEDKVRDILYRQELSANIEKLKYSSDGTRLMVYTYDGNIHIINTETQKIIRTVYRREYTEENGFAVLNVQVDQNTGYVLMSDCLLSLNLTDGTVNWRFASPDS
ncbi:MAG: TIR domain-containing protein, partial [Clostridia bacterium]|nr:TIR domain-containing protein [Clostridia bacterium]